MVKDTCCCPCHQKFGPPPELEPKPKRLTNAEIKELLDRAGIGAEELGKSLEKMMGRK